MVFQPYSRDDWRFGDWRMALKSILGFWLFYAATVAIRSLMSSDPASILINKVPIVTLGICLSGMIYVAIAIFARNASVLRKATVAFLASIVASLVMASSIVLLDRFFIDSAEEFKVQAREGFTIIEKGQQIIIERAAQEPLVLTVPTLDKLDRSKQFRYAADAAVVWSFFFLAWSAFYVAMRAQAGALAVQRRLADAESAAQAAHVRALRYQVNPHFLFNTLNSLSSLVMTGRTDRAEAMLLALSTFFRTSLSLDPSADVTLAEEIDLQRLYLDIEETRFPERLNVEIDVPDNLSTAKLPALILQPLVENAIKYGVSKSRKAVVVRIEAALEDDGRMRVEVSNRLKSGGRDELPAATHEGTGLGITNVCQRLEARFGSMAQCRWGPIPSGGFKVSLTLPVEK